MKSILIISSYLICSIITILQINAATSEQPEQSNKCARLSANGTTAMTQWPICFSSESIRIESTGYPLISFDWLRSISSVGGGGNYDSLQVMHNFLLQSLVFRELRSIVGNVRIFDNPNLRVSINHIIKYTDEYQFLS